MTWAEKSMYNHYKRVIMIYLFNASTNGNNKLTGNISRDPSSERVVSMREFEHLLLHQTYDTVLLLEEIKLSFLVCTHFFRKISIEVLALVTLMLPPLNVWKYEQDSTTSFDY